jgi:hypothetical protein
MADLKRSAKRKMNAKTRVAMEIFAPAMIGTILLIAGRHAEFARTMGFSPQVLLPYLVFAYAFALLPSLLYAFVMERWLRSRPLDAMRRLGAIGLLTLLGLGSGYIISWASEVPVTWIGVIVGLILGLILGLSAESRQKEKPSPSPGPTPSSGAAAP